MDTRKTIELSGRTVVTTIDFPGPTLLDGGGTARLWLDDNASAEQREELQAIFQGKKGGPMAIFQGLVTTWLPTESARIELRGDGDKLTITVARAGSVESRLLKDPEGRVMTMQNVGFASAFNFDDLRGELAPGAARWSDPAMPHQFEHRSGARGRFSWKVA